MHSELSNDDLYLFNFQLSNKDAYNSHI